MDMPAAYEIRIKGRLTEGWSDWFEGMTVSCNAADETTLLGRLADQAELIGVLNRLQGLNLSVISVNKIYLEP